MDVAYHPMHATCMIAYSLWFRAWLQNYKFPADSQHGGVLTLLLGCIHFVAEAADGF